MKLAICGSRHLKQNFDLNYLESIINKLNISVTEIVSGGAKGADKVAELYAAKQSLKLKIFHAQWQTFGISAGTVRNKQVVDYANYVAVLWDGKSKGTRHVIEYSGETGKPIEIIILPQQYFKAEKPKRLKGILKVREDNLTVLL